MLPKISSVSEGFCKGATISIFLHCTGCGELAASRSLLGKCRLYWTRASSLSRPCTYVRSIPDVAALRLAPVAVAQASFSQLSEVNCQVRGGTRRRTAHWNVPDGRRANGNLVVVCNKRLAPSNCRFWALSFILTVCP